MGKFNDHIRILQHLSFRRIVNASKLSLSYAASRIFKKNYHQGLPLSLSIEPTTACNLGCPECPSGLKQFSRPTGKLNIQLHERILQEISPTVFYINYYFQGEPFLHPQFLELIKSAKKYNIYTATSTNAHFITPQKATEIIDSGLDRLIISLDGLTQETYENYRVHGNLTTVLSAIDHLVKAKKEAKKSTPHLIVQFLAVKQNEHEIPQVIALGKQLGVDEVRIKTAQLYDYKHGNPLLPSNEKYARYKLQKDGTYALKWKTGNHCWRMWSSSVITFDGKMVPCCFDKDAHHQLGEISQDSIKNIWNSTKYNQFRSAILTKRQQIDICKNCSEGAKIWA